MAKNEETWKVISGEPSVTFKGTNCMCRRMISAAFARRVICNFCADAERILPKHTKPGRNKPRCQQRKKPGFQYNTMHSCSGHAILTRLKALVHWESSTNEFKLKDQLKIFSTVKLIQILLSSCLPVTAVTPTFAVVTTLFFCPSPNLRSNDDVATSPSVFAPCLLTFLFFFTSFFHVSCSLNVVLPFLLDSPNMCTHTRVHIHTNTLCFLSPHISHLS